MDNFIIELESSFTSKLLFYFTILFNFYIFNSFFFSLCSWNVFSINYFNNFVSLRESSSDYFITNYLYIGVITQSWDAGTTSILLFNNSSIYFFSFNASIYLP